MPSSNKDYKRLYLLQDRFLAWWSTLGLPFYLTGGTALGRYYLNHRYSEDLDFFTNSDPRFGDFLKIIWANIGQRFNVDHSSALITEDFARIFIQEDGVFLKIEWVNDVKYYAGTYRDFKFGRIDNPINILANKLTAITGRDEPKDIFDILHIALNYSFVWGEIFLHAKEKTIINEIDVEERLFSFPVEWFENIPWMINPADLDATRKNLLQIADDFLLGNVNSLGIKKLPIDLAQPIVKFLPKV